MYGKSYPTISRAEMRARDRVQACLRPSMHPRAAAQQISYIKLCYTPMAQRPTHLCTLLLLHFCLSTHIAFMKGNGPLPIYEAFLKNILSTS